MALRTHTLLAVLVAFAGSFGCSDHDGDDDAGTAGDATITAQDASPKDAGGDAAITWMPDSGTNDSGNESMEAGTRACAEAREPLPSNLLPRCSAATHDCIEACGANDFNCSNACLNGDTTTPSALLPIGCQTCVFLQLLTCASQNGCQEPVGNLFCCLEDKCPPGSAPNCGDQMCQSEIEAAVTCAYVKHPACLEFTQGLPGQCFAASDDDAGVAGP